MAASPDSAIACEVQTKVCSKCAVDKPLSSFYMMKGRHVAACKDCARIAGIKYREENKDAVRDRKAAYFQSKKEILVAKGREWRLANPEKQRKYEEEYRAQNREVIRARGVEYFAANKEVHTERVRSYRSRNPDKVAQFNATSYANRSSSPKYRVEAAIRTAVNRTIRLGAKESRTFELLGYSSSDLMSHLEKQFLPGMTWENYGDWHIDHEIPLVAHEYETADDADFKRAWALSNLQPLWAIDNIKKGGRILAMTDP